MILTFRIKVESESCCGVCQDGVTMMPCGQMEILKKKKKCDQGSAKSILSVEKKGQRNHIPPLPPPNPLPAFHAVVRALNTIPLAWHHARATPKGGVSVSQ